ncbi:MAG: hypothetical protein KA314_10940 [Chloroflexi bacterium]|nr:hypothetical protein [Chloroflexota bacterium]MBP8056350.1 hypothetical protein [Chloroflexota bacterium]
MSEENFKAQLNERQKQMIRETVAGYAAANEYLEQERKERLARLTPEEARRIYSNLVEAWHSLRNRQGENELYNAWRLETKLKVREAFKKLAVREGYL